MKNASAQPSFATLFRIALPLIAAYSGWTVFNAVDQWFIRLLGEAPLAAVGIAATISWTFQVPAVGMIGVAGLRVATEFRKGNAGGVARMNQFALMVAGIMGAVGLLLAIKPNLILQFYGLNDETAANAREILLWYFLSGLPLMLASTAHSSLEGVGRTRTVMLLMLLCFSINTFGNALFIFGLFGAPQLGLRGVGIATLAANVADALVAWFVWGRFLHANQIPLMRRFADWWLSFRDFVMNASGNSLREVANMVKWALLGWLLSFCGTTVVAAYSIAALWSSILFIPIHAMGRATGILVGQHMAEGSAGQPAREFYLRRGMLANAVYSLLLIGICFLFARVFTGIHAPPDWEIGHPGRMLAITLLIIVSFHSLADSAGTCLRQALDAVGDTWAPVRYHLLLLTGVFPVLLLLRFFVESLHGHTVAIVAMGIIFCFYALWSFLCLRHWRKNHSGCAVPQNCATKP